MNTPLNYLFLGLIVFLTFHAQWSLKVAVLGGGAAGYFAAIQCAEVMKKEGVKDDTQVMIFEGTKEVLQKVLISGGGRCNVQHDPSKAVVEISKGYPRGQHELLGPLSKTFGPSETKLWFENKGVQLKTEADGRVFPITDKSLTIKKALEDAAESTGIVKVCCNSKVVSVEKENVNDNRFIVNTISMSGSNNEKRQEKHYFDRVIAATGSSRQGHEMMSNLGHSIVPPVPSLFSFKINDNNLTQLSGLSTELSEVKLVIPKEFSKNNKALLRFPFPFICICKKHFLNNINHLFITTLYRSNLLPSLTQRGPLLITHQGLSGPGILRLSAFGARVMAAMKYEFQIDVKWIVDCTFDDMVNRLTLEREKHPTRSIGKRFPSICVDGNNDGDDDDKIILSRRLWHFIIKRAKKITPDDVWQKLGKSDIARLASEITNTRFNVKGRGLYRDEFVTAGGVSLKEINFDTMESKIVPGLFVIGELLNVDGVTGGFNFQSAWTGGWIAGNSAGHSYS